MVVARSEGPERRSAVGAGREKPGAGCSPGAGPARCEGSEGVTVRKPVWPRCRLRFPGGLVLALLVALTVFSAARPARALAATPPDPTAVTGMDRLGNLPDFSASAVNDDATALFVNPAGIGRSYPFGYYLGWDESKDRGDGRWDAGTVGLTAGPIGLGFQQLRPAGDYRLDRWILASGSGPGPFAVGVRNIYERWRQPGMLSNAWRMDAGVLWRPARFFSLGVIGEDLNQDRLLVGGPVYPRTYALGLGLRPLPMDHNSRLTLFGDLIGRENQSWKHNATLQAGLLIEPIAGITLSGSVAGSLQDFAGSRVFRFGVGLHGRHLSYQSGYRYDASDRYAHTVQAFQGTVARQRSLAAEPVLARIPIAGTYADEDQKTLGLPIPFLGAPDQSSIRPILRQLDRAAAEPDVRGVLLELGPVSMGALTDEVRDGITRVRRAGKPVVAWMEEGSGFGQYYIASACDRIVLDPISEIASLGFRADILYYGAMLDSAGVQVEKVAHGKYKTAYEQLILTHASEGMKESVDSVVDDMRQGMLARVSDERKIPLETLSELADGQIIESPRALHSGLVDSLGDQRAAERILGELAGREGTSTVSIEHWKNRTYSWADGARVAVLWVDGGIERGPSRRGLLSANVMGSETVVGQLRALKDRHDVKAVVLRVDSGGGDGLASDQMWRAVHELRAAGKKVVASMSRVAGSGGYYIACGADEIYADPMTITGSIGVLAIKPNFAGFYRRHRIGVETFERGRMMGMNSSAVPLTDEQRQQMNDEINLFYDHFLDRVSAGRPLSKDQVNEVAQGRIWTGRQALDRKLIDHLGGLDDAISRARELAGLPVDARVVNLYRPEPSFLARVFMGGAGKGDEARAVAGLLAAGSDLSPLDLWVFQRVQAAGGGLDALGWRAENPLLEPLARSY